MNKAPQTAFPALAKAEADERYEEVISGVRAAVAEDPRAALSDPWVKAWIARRYRNLFLHEALRDDHAVDVAKDDRQGLFDLRPTRLKVADRFMEDFDGSELNDDLPPAPEFTAQDTTILFAPGLLTGLLPDLAMKDVWPGIRERFGVEIIASDSHPMRTCEANSADLAAALVEGIGHDADSEMHDASAPIPPSHRVVVMGYSKGGPDTLTFLLSHPELVDRVKAVVGWAGAFLGSPTADDILKSDDILVPDLMSHLERILNNLAPMIPGDMGARLQYRQDEYDIPGALHSLSWKERHEWFDQNREALDALDVPFFTFAGDTSVSEVPIYQMGGTKKLNEIDDHNDMQVIVSDAQLDLPMSTHVATFRAHHWDLSYPPFPEMGIGPVGKFIGHVVAKNTDHPFPRLAAVSAIVMMLHELGLFD